MRKINVVVWLGTRTKIKLASMAVIVLLLAVMFTYEVPTMQTWSYWSTPLSGKVIVLDAGHGGPDGGASSKEGVIEKDITLAITLHLRDYLQQSGALVYMTRETDRDLAKLDTKGLSKRKTQDLLTRAKYIQDKAPNLLVSIHLNSIPSSVWHGAQTFYSPKIPQSKALASLIQDEMKTHFDTIREAKTVQTVYLLKTSEVPSALVEIGFLSNPEEARLMAGETYQKKVAEAVYRGILRYSAGENLVQSK